MNACRRIALQSATWIVATALVGSAGCESASGPPRPVTLTPAEEAASDAAAAAAANGEGRVTVPGD